MADHAEITNSSEGEPVVVRNPEPQVDHDRIPQEIISHVMSFLEDYDDLLRASMVSKKWYGASFYAAMKMDLQMSISVDFNGECVSTMDGLKINQTISVISAHFVDKHPDRSSRPTKLFIEKGRENKHFAQCMKNSEGTCKCLGVDLRVLSVADQRYPDGLFSVDSFCSFVRGSCPNLRLLEINSPQILAVMEHGREDEFKATLQMLVGIRMTHNVEEFEQLAFLLKSFPNLEHCWVENCALRNDVEIRDQWELDLPGIDISQFEELVRSFPRKLYLKYMTISIEDFVSSGYLLGMIQDSSLQVESLIFVGDATHVMLSGISLDALCSKVRRMTLEIRGPMSVLQRCRRVISASRCLDNLTIYLDVIDYHFMEIFSNLPDVESVRIRPVRGATALLRIQFLKAPGIHLKKMNIHLLSMVEEQQALYAIIGVLREYYSNLSGELWVHFGGISPQIFRSFFTTFGDLKLLGFQEENDIEKYCVEEHRKKFTTTRTVDDTGRISRLTSLSLDSCIELHIDSILSMPFPDLRELYLGRCYNLTDAGLKDLAQSAPDLRILDLSSCYQITDDGVSAVVSSLGRLREMHLGQCWSLTAQCLRSMIEHKPPLLKLVIDPEWRETAPESVDKLTAVIPSCRVVNSYNNEVQ